MNQREIRAVAQAQLAVDLNCTVEALGGEKDSLVFVEARDNSGRRLFPREKQHFEMLSMGNAIIVSATPDILRLVRPLLEGKGRDEAFSMPFVYGLGVAYLPELRRLRALPEIGGFTYAFVEREDIAPLYQTEGFRNALSYDVHHPRPDVLAVVAMHEGGIAGIAGVSADCADMWQVGIDVLPAYRGKGLAASLVSTLTCETLRRGKVPYYCASVSNIASQRVAHRVGYAPAWVTSYRLCREYCLPCVK